jgi:putative ABC transport system substrate-binding protein
MRRAIKIFFTACFIFVGIFVQNAFCAGKAVIVLGVTEEYLTPGGAFELCVKAVQSSLKEGGVSEEIVFSKIDEAANDADRDALGKETAEKVRTLKPDVLIALGDHCLRLMAKNIEDVPIVGGFFFSPPPTLGLPKPNVTAVTRGSYAADIWKMANQLTGAKTVGMISRNSFAMEGVKKTIMEKASALEKVSGVKLVDMYLCDTMEQWEDLVKKWPAELLYIIDSSRMTKGDKVLTSEETVKWTVENCAVPVIATNEMDTRYGAMFSIVVSEPAWGRHVAAMALKILSGTPVANIPMEAVKDGNLLINSKTVEKYKIEIPYEILTSASHVYE